VRGRLHRRPGAGHTAASDPEAAELVAAEIRAISHEFWPIERPGTALTSVREIADYVKDAPFWGLWWD
jgi:hypothetical protein